MRLTCRERAEASGQMGRRAYLRAGSREEQGRQALHPARRPSVRQRPHPYRPCLQQDPQGLREQVPCAARVLHALRAGWDCHGQPIEHMVEKTLGPDKMAKIDQPTLRRLCREWAEKYVDVQREASSASRERRLGASVPHVHAELRGGQRRGVQADVPRRLGVPRPQTHPLVQALPHGAGRGRDRVLRRDVAVHLREVQDGYHARHVRDRRRCGRRLRAHLDHHALDASGEHGRVAGARRRLRDGPGGRLQHDHGARAGGTGGRDRGLGILRPRARRGRRARRAQGP